MPTKTIFQHNLNFVTVVCLKNGTKNILDHKREARSSKSYFKIAVKNSYCYNTHSYATAAYGPVRASITKQMTLEAAIDWRRQAFSGLTTFHLQKK